MKIPQLLSRWIVLMNFISLTNGNGRRETHLDKKVVFITVTDYQDRPETSSFHGRYKISVVVIATLRAIKIEFPVSIKLLKLLMQLAIKRLFCRLGT
jgi:hypothetical protein